MASILSPTLVLDTHKPIHYCPNKLLSFSSSKKTLFSINKLERFNSINSVPSPSSDLPVSPSKFYSFLDDPYRGGRFLSNEEIEKLKELECFVYLKELRCGNSLWVRAMRLEELDATVALLAESFAESMAMSLAYEAVLRFLVKQYLIERRALMPHAVTLVAFYRDSGGAEALAGTVEVCFDPRGLNASLPTPTPPKNSPYICNMTVTKALRRRGIGWQLLQASEELITHMTCSKQVHLHCRMIDTAPFNMYTKAGYEIVKTDTIFVLLLLQRRKHLMCKKLPEIHPSTSTSHIPEQVSLQSSVS